MPEIKAAPVAPKVQMIYTTAELLAMISVGQTPPYRLIDDKGIVIVWNEEKEAYLESSFASQGGKPVYFDISRDTLEHKWQLVNPTKAHLIKHGNNQEEE